MRMLLKQKECAFRLITLFNNKSVVLFVDVVFASFGSVLVIGKKVFNELSAFCEFKRYLSLSAQFCDTYIFFHRRKCCCLCQK